MLVLALLQPAPALADDECGTQIDSGNPETFDCPDPDYPEGVTYAADGDLTVNFTNGGVTTIGENPDNGGDDPEPGDDLTDRGGIDLSATGSDSIIFDSATTGTEIESDGVLGALLSVTTVDGNIDIDTEDMVADESAAGVTHAIRAESTGNGSIDITTTDVDASSLGLGSGTNPPDSIGIEAITGSGSLTISAAAPVRGNDAAIDATTGTGLLTINFSSSSSTTSSTGGIRTNSGGGTVINIASGRGVSDGIEAGGSTLALNNDGTLRGALDFSDLDGGYTFNNSGTWSVGDISADSATVSDLGAGDWNNTGTAEIRRRTLVSAPGTNFTGAGASTLAINADLIGGSQFNCSSPTIAGCVDLTGGTTSGQTAIRIIGQGGGNFSDPIDAQASAGVVLVDVGGGTTSADHFVLDPGSGFFSGGFNNRYAEHPIYDSVLVTGGPFNYTLLYNPEKQQHVLANVPQREAIEYVAFIDETLSIWHTTTDAVAGRQADLRDKAEDGRVWGRLVQEKTDSDVTPVFASHGNTFVYDQQGEDYSLETRAAIIGYDLFTSDNHVIGLHIGAVTAKLEYAGSESHDEVRGATLGAYGGWWNDAGLTVDAALNVNTLNIDHDQESLEDSDTSVKSMGLRAEAGWRVAMSEALYIQPLATVAYVKSDISALSLRDNQLRFKGDESARAALGVRFGGEAAISGRSLNYWLTARAWDEQEDGGRVEFVTDADPLAIQNDLSGSFEEFNLGVETGNAAGDVSYYVSGGVKSGDLIDSNYNVSIGARMRW